MTLCDVTGAVGFIFGQAIISETLAGHSEDCANSSFCVFVGDVNSCP